MGKKVIAAYCRTAVADDAAIAQQKVALLHYAVACGYGDDTIVFYEDNGYSGNSMERPDMQRLSRDIAEGKVTTLLVHNLSRVSRDSAARYKWVVEARARGATILSATDPYAPQFLDFLKNSI